MNSSDYDKKMGRAKKSADDFGASLAKGIGSAAGKVAGALGLAMGAAEGFQKTINSNQRASDTYNETLQGLKSSVNEFFYAISTGDFTAFTDGLTTITQRAREAYRALDQLGNAKISFSVAQALSQRDIAEGQLLAKNKFAPTDVRVGGFKKWEEGINAQVAYNDQLSSDIQNYILKAVESKAGIKNFSANLDNTMNAILIDIQEKSKRQALKSKYAQEYSQFEAEAERAKEIRDDKSIGLKPWERERMQAEREYNQTMQGLAERYNEAITVNSLLNKYTDDELNVIANYVKEMISLTNAISGLKREYNETANEFNNANKTAEGFKPINSFEGYTVYSGGEAGRNFGGGGGTAAEIIPSGSLAELEKSIQAARKAYTTATTDAARQAAYQTLQELERRKGVIELHARVVMPPSMQKGGSIAELAEGIGELPPITFEPVKAESVDNIRNINEEIAVMSNLMTMANSATTAGADGWLQWMTNVIQATSTAIAAIRGVVMAKQAEGAASAGASAAQSGPFGWLMIAPAIAAAIAAFAAIPKFAEGGIVGGSSFFGDKLLARVNSGEMILNQKQQGRLLGALETPHVVVDGEARVSGKDIFISLRNYMKATGNRL